MCFKKAVAKSSGFSRIFAFGLMIFSGAGLINLCTVCAETTDELQGPPVVQSHIIGIDPGHQGPNVDMRESPCVFDGLQLLHYNMTKPSV